MKAKKITIYYNGQIKEIKVKKFGLNVGQTLALGFKVNHFICYNFQALFTSKDLLTVFSDKKTQIEFTFKSKKYKYTNEGIKISGDIKQLINGCYEITWSSDVYPKRQKI